MVVCHVLWFLATTAVVDFEKVFQDAECLITVGEMKQPPTIETVVYPFTADNLDYERSLADLGVMVWFAKQKRSRVKGVQFPDDSGCDTQLKMACSSLKRAVSTEAGQAAWNAQVLNPFEYQRIKEGGLRMWVL